LRVFSAFFAIKIFELVRSRVRLLQNSSLEKPLIAKLAEAAAKIAQRKAKTVVFFAIFAGFLSALCD
jgi:hypothetical protein